MTRPLKLNKFKKKDNFKIIIQVRLASSRLPKKVLKKIYRNQSMLEFLLNRLSKKFKKQNILIALAKDKMNLPLIKLFNKYNIRYYEGSENNVLNRYYKCAQKFKVDNIIRITSDCPLIDTDLIFKMIRYFKANNCEYLSNTQPEKIKTFPDGSDIEVFKFNSLKKMMKLKLARSDKEHVTNKFWSLKIFKSKLYNYKKDLSQYRYSVDYYSDIINVKKIIHQLIKNKLKFTTINIINIIDKDNSIKNTMFKNIIKQKKRRQKIFKL